MPRSDQQLRDDVKNQMRMNRNRNTFITVRNELEELLDKKFQRAILLEQVTKTASKFRIKVDRCAKRRFDILICWCCENWLTIKSELTTNIKNYLDKEEKNRIQEKPLVKVSEDFSIFDTFIEDESSYNTEPFMLFKPVM